MDKSTVLALCAVAVALAAALTILLIRRGEKRKRAEFEKQQAIKKKQAKRQEEAKLIEQAMQKFENNPVAVCVSDKLSNEILRGIQELDRDVHRTDIKYEKSFGASCNTEGALAGCYRVNEYRRFTSYHAENHCYVDFYKENFKPLPSTVDTFAFLRAVAKRTQELVSAELDANPLDNDFSLDKKESVQKWRSRCEMIITFTYSGKNKQYIPPKEW